MFPKRGKIKIAKFHPMQMFAIQSYYNYKSSKWLMFKTKKKYQKTLKSLKAHMIPHSSLKCLLAHLSNLLLLDNKLSDHCHTHTDRVSYAYINKN